ncbi:MAG: 4-hydroxy-2-oxovalerate aldolase [Candidatus Nanopelagicales bacterium]|jgi:4-hydroxy 2-oxovalerate aldolase|nr:4-hydroxy-2-oxovalerate aldolase [Actinomycetota bacterium]NDG95281.1 4-hydroxy-2-oxovalerate aldolase [Actinomycetota bacterium]NDH14416.1 4-hydroxy-2-oxovalerate aldolase [Actinomycetota bacterium]NDH18796.1 4-hydroxy-2-oxovalerate aldolase [Actinomycetota bacterium]
MTNSSVDYRLIDSTLRDGSHAISHQYDEDNVIAIVRGLSAAGVQVIEIAHGDGLGGSSFNYGFSKVDEKELIARACQEAGDSTIACLLLPGVGLADDLKDVKELGVGMARIATHCTEADISEQHIQMAKKLDMEAIGFLMMAHMNSPEGLVEQALLMQSYGADAIYIADSAGAMTTEDVQRRVSALVKALDIPLGVHAHNNLAMAVSNSIAAYEEGAANLDGTSAGLGAGAGNCPTEILAAVSNKYGIETGVDALKLMDVAEEVVRPIMPRQQVIDRAGLILGYAGVYGSFLLHAQKAAERYDVPQAEILMELGRRQVVGGQEDMIIDVALELARKHAEANE